MDRIAAGLTQVSPLRTETAVRAGERCKICDGEVHDFDLVDANKVCSEADPYQYGLCGVGVRYVRCGSCGFVFTSDFDCWDQETFVRHIYNEDYVKVDGDYVANRPARSAAALAELLQGFEALRILDYGSGTGGLAASLSQRGFAKVVSYDPLSQPERPAGVFDLVTCIETIEHVPDPVGV